MPNANQGEGVEIELEPELWHPQLRVPVNSPEALQRVHSEVREVGQTAPNRSYDDQHCGGTTTRRERHAAGQQTQEGH